MKTTHTPGPWFIDQYGHVYGWQQTEGNNTQSVVLLDGRHSDATVHDKLLMAASPDMLAALEFISASLAVYRGNANPRCLESIEEHVNAAIAKATGQD